MAEVFVGLIEVRPEHGCEVVDSDVIGAFARCYAAASDKQAAEAKMREHLEQQGFSVVRTEFCESGRDAKFENPDSPEAAQWMKEAEDSGEVVLGRLDSWTSEDD
ncbi:MAG TPA: hypothetical protein VGK67_09820 [Myxococcales bacterium]|jgi:hypothetical protein